MLANSRFIDRSINEGLFAHHLLGFDTLFRPLVACIEPPLAVMPPIGGYQKVERVS
jgi:hypothetical protein